MTTQKRYGFYLFLFLQAFGITATYAKGGKGEKIEVLDAEEWSKKLKNNNFTPYEIKDATYGKDKTVINVTEKLQPFAAEGTFPDIKTLKANTFFGNDPKPGKKKAIVFTAIMKEYASWTKSLPPRPVGEPKLVTYKVVIGESATDLVIPKKPILPALPAQETPADKPALPAQETPADKPALPVQEAPNSGTVKQDATGVITPLLAINPDALQWPANGTITLQQLGNILVLNNNEKFEIVDAWYGIKGNEKNYTNRIKERLQKAANKGNFPVPDNMNQFFDGEPIKGKKKTLYISFKMGDHAYEISIPEHKSDRGTYTLPVQQTLPDETTIWFQERTISGLTKPSALVTLSFSDRLKNLFSLFKHDGKEYDTAILSELAYFAENQKLASESEKVQFPALFRNAKIRFKSDDNLFKKVTDIISKNNITFDNSDLLIEAKANLDWKTKTEDDIFLATVQTLVEKNQQGLLSANETLELKGLLFATQMINKDDKYEETVRKIKELENKITLPTPPTPAPTPDASAAAPAPSSEPKIEASNQNAPEKPAEVVPVETKEPEILTYEDRLQAVANIVTFADATAKITFLDNLEKLILERARASSEQLSRIQDLLSYYSNLSTAFKNDAELKKRLDSMSTTFNSGIAYKDRLAAADSLIKAEKISIKQKYELFGILKELATEQAKGNQAEISLARAYLIMAQKQFTEKADQDALAQIEIIFNTPPTPTIAPEAQAQTAAKDPIKSTEEVKKAIEETKKEEISTSPESKNTETKTEEKPVVAATPAQAAANAVVANAQVIAETAKTAEPTSAPATLPVDATYSQKVMGGFAQILATQMNPSEKALSDARTMLEDLVKNRELASDADLEMLKSLLSYAAQNISEATFIAKVKELAAQMGTSVDFSSLLKKFNEMITDKLFATSKSRQNDALSLARKIVNSLSKTASLDEVANLKASLIAAQGLFVEAKDKEEIAALQKSIVVPTVSSAPLPEVTTKKPETLTKSFEQKIGEALAIRNFFSAENRIQFIEKINAVVSDRSRGMESEIQSVLAVIKTALQDPSFSQDQIDKLKAFSATLSRPATNAEQVDELEEMSTLPAFESFHNIELLYVMQNLSKNIATLDANLLTRVKALMLLLQPKIGDDYRDAFTRIKAIFEAPIQVVAPVAAVQTGQAPAAVAAAPKEEARAAVTPAPIVKTLSAEERDRLEKQRAQKNSMLQRTESFLNNPNLDPRRKESLQKVYDATKKDIDAIDAQLASNTVISSAPANATSSSNATPAPAAPAATPQTNITAFARPAGRAIPTTSRSTIRPTMRPIPTRPTSGNSALTGSAPTNVTATSQVRIAPSRIPSRNIPGSLQPTTTRSIPRTRTPVQQNNAPIQAVPAPANTEVGAPLTPNLPSIDTTVPTGEQVSAVPSTPVAPNQPTSTARNPVTRADRIKAALEKRRIQATQVKPEQRILPVKTTN